MQHTTQHCFRCKEDLPLEAFSPSRRGRNGVWCRSCHSGYNRDRNQARARKPNTPCSVCAKPMFSVLPPDQAICLSCRQERARSRKQVRRSHPRKRVCPMCRRTFEHNRRAYCSLFCKRIGSQVGGFKSFMRMEGEYRNARWWTATHEDQRWIIGPPPPQGIDVWITPNGEILCPDCATPMHDAGDTAHECNWCWIRVILNG